MQLKIKIPTVREAFNLNYEATCTPENIWVHSCDGMMMVDAKSVIGVCALTGVDCKLVAEEAVSKNDLISMANKAGVEIVKE